MFGKPTWFRLKHSGRGLRPITWQGWGYTLVWVGVLCVPFLVFVSRHLLAESMIWVAAGFAFLLWEVRQIAKQIQAEDDADVLYIGDDDAPSSHLSPDNLRSDEVITAEYVGVANRTHLNDAIPDGPIPNRTMNHREPVITGKFDLLPRV